MIDELSYDEKLNYIDTYLKLPGTSIEGDNLLTLICLTCHLTMLFQKKEDKDAKEQKRDKRDIRPFHILANACGKPDMGSQQELHQKVSLLCELCITREAVFGTCGFKTAKEMMSGIKGIMNEWLPF